MIIPVLGISKKQYINILTLLWIILTTRQLSFFLIKRQESKMKICSVLIMQLIHGLFVPMFDWYLPNPQNIWRIHLSKWMPWHCFCHYVCILWHRQTGFRDYLSQGLFAWQWTYSAWFAQTVAANEPFRSCWTTLSHSKLYCLETISTTNDIQCIPLFKKKGMIDPRHKKSAILPKVCYIICNTSWKHLNQDTLIKFNRTTNISK